MTLSVLSDDQIRSLLENLTVEELNGFQETLRNALYEYSKSTQTDHVDGIYQIERTSVHSKETGATTLFMPSSSSTGNGVKGEAALPQYHPLFQHPTLIPLSHHPHPAQREPRQTRDLPYGRHHPLRA